LKKKKKLRSTIGREIKIETEGGLVVHNNNKETAEGIAEGKKKTYSVKDAFAPAGAVSAISALLEYAVHAGAYERCEEHRDA
jgi:hypothetical protein